MSKHNEKFNKIFIVIFAPSIFLITILAMLVSLMNRVQIIKSMITLIENKASIKNLYWLTVFLSLIILPIGMFVTNNTSSEGSELIAIIILTTVLLAFLGVPFLIFIMVGFYIGIYIAFFSSIFSILFLILLIWASELNGIEFLFLFIKGTYMYSGEIMITGIIGIPIIKFIEWYDNKQSNPYKGNYHKGLSYVREYYRKNGVRVRSHVKNTWRKYN